MNKFCKKCGKKTFWRVVGTETDCIICGYGEEWDVNFHSLSRSSAGELFFSKKEKQNTDRTLYKNLDTAAREYKAISRSTWSGVDLVDGELLTSLQKTLANEEAAAAKTLAESKRDIRLLLPDRDSRPTPQRVKQFVAGLMSQNKPLEYIANEIFEMDYMESRKALSTYVRINNWFGKEVAAAYLDNAGIHDPIVGDIVSIGMAARRRQVTYSKLRNLVEGGQLKNYGRKNTLVVSLKELDEVWINNPKRVRLIGPGRLWRQNARRLWKLLGVEKELRVLVRKNISINQMSKLVVPRRSPWALKSDFVDIYGEAEYIKYATHGYDTSVLSLRSKLTLTTPTRPLRSIGRWELDNSCDLSAGRDGARQSERALSIET
tara:strand:- start:1468 stop:2595 length:1128 start_codon:yes stop_codon:yes gene_type:complete